MKTKILSVGSAVLASGLAIMLSYALGARGETLGIIAVITLFVSCTTAFVAASIGLRRKPAAQTLEQ